MFPLKKSIGVAILSFVLSFAILGVAQVIVTPGGYATSPGQDIPEAGPSTPLVATPSVSLSDQTSQPKSNEVVTVHHADFITANPEEKSLAEIAHEYSHPANPQRKVFTNADLEALHPAEEQRATPSQSLSTEPSADHQGSETPGQTSDQTGGNAAGLPQSDQAGERFDATQKPSAGHKSVKSEIQQQVEELRKNKK